MLFQTELQTGDEASTCARSTSPVPSSSYSTTDVTTEPSDCATATSACKANITIDYPVNEMKKTVTRDIACGVAEVSKLRCNGCEIDHPSQLQHNCLLPDDILIGMHFDEAVEKFNSTAVIRGLVDPFTRGRSYTIRRGATTVECRQELGGGLSFRAMAK